MDVKRFGQEKQIAWTWPCGVVTGSGLSSWDCQIRLSAACKSYAEANTREGGSRGNINICGRTKMSAKNERRLLSDGDVQPHRWRGGSEKKARQNQLALRCSLKNIWALKKKNVIDAWNSAAWAQRKGLKATNTHIKVEEASSEEEKRKVTCPGIQEKRNCTVQGRCALQQQVKHQRHGGRQSANQTRVFKLNACDFPEPVV